MTSVPPVVAATNQLYDSGFQDRKRNFFLKLNAERARWIVEDHVTQRLISPVEIDRYLKLTVY